MRRLLLAAAAAIAPTALAGNFTLTFNGQTTAAMADTAAPATVQAALNALPTVGGSGGSVAVSGGPGSYAVTFGGAFAGQNEPPMTGAGTGESVGVSTATDGMQETQTAMVSGGSGTFTLTFSGSTTSALAFNASAASVQAALDALPSVAGAGGSVGVSLGAGVYTVVFGAALSGVNVPQMTGSGSGGAAIATATLANGADEVQQVTVTAAPVELSQVSAE